MKWFVATRMLALWLVIICVAPCTAPFSTYDFDNSSPRSGPDETHSQDVSMLKAKAGTDKLSLDLILEAYLTPSFQEVVCPVTTRHYRTIDRSIPQEILRI
jgi:hypothetical protein